jgi:hypothetical protein
VSFEVQNRVYGVKIDFGKLLGETHMVSHYMAVPVPRLCGRPQCLIVSGKGVFPPSDPPTVHDLFRGSVLPHQISPPHTLQNRGCRHTCEHILLVNFPTSYPKPTHSLCQKLPLSTSLKRDLRRKVKI